MTTNRKGTLKNSPLVYVLASIRYATLGLLPQKIAEIQNELRRDFPIFTPINMQQPQLSPSGINTNELVSKTSWLLMSRNSDYGIQIFDDQILFFSKKYTDFSSFNKIISSGLSALFKFMGYVDVINLGVRYIDHVTCAEGHSISDYIHDGLLPPAIDGLNRIGGVLFGVYGVGSDNVRVRCTNQEGAPAIPEDVMPLVFIINGVMNKPVNFSLLSKNELTLDIDVVRIFDEAKAIEEKEELLSIISDLHDKANSFFRSEKVFTDVAFELWNR